MMRDCGAKVIFAELAAREPTIGLIRKVHGNGACMAYRYNCVFLLETDGSVA